MNVDKEKVEQTVLALLYLTSFGDKSGLRAWKGHDGGEMNSLYVGGNVAKSFRRHLDHRFRSDARNPNVKAMKKVERDIETETSGKMARLATF